MPHSYDYDAIVIGSGPGGEGAAMGLVKQGARVAVIERYQNVGGGCTHWGTIPSKALRHAVSRIIEFNQNPLYSDHSRLLRSSFADILNHADNVINQQTRMRQGFYERNQCKLFAGDARFIDANTVSVSYMDGTQDTIRAITFAEVVVLMMDKDNAFDVQDLQLADLVEREGRALIAALPGLQAKR